MNPRIADFAPIGAPLDRCRSLVSCLTALPNLAV